MKSQNARATNSNEGSTFHGEGRKNRVIALIKPPSRSVLGSSIRDHSIRRDFPARVLPELFSTPFFPPSGGAKYCDANKRANW